MELELTDPNTSDFPFFSATDIEVIGSDLTYRSDPEGAIATNGDSVAIGVRRVPNDFRPPHHTSYDLLVNGIGEIQPAYKAHIIKSYGESGWSRLQELLQDTLTALPENPSAIQHAWIAGLHLNGGEYIAKMRARFAQSKANVEAEISAEQVKRDRVKELEAFLQPQVLSNTKTPNEEGGYDYHAKVEIAGAVYHYRNIFDAGCVIHPPDGIGVASANVWWLPSEAERPMTAAELLAIEYLRLCPPTYSGINM